jgi:hypothetical protein
MLTPLCLLMLHRRATRIFSRPRFLIAHRYFAGIDVTTDTRTMQFGSDETLTNETREGGCVGLTDITPCVLASCSLTLTHIYGTMHARGFGHPGM